MAATLPTKNNPAPRWFARAKVNSFLVQVDNKDATLGQAMSVNMVQPRGCWQNANAVATWQKQATKNPLDGGFSGLLAATTQWRPRSESNRRTRLCRPLYSQEK
jgi:hypothetical protein